MRTQQCSSIQRKQISQEVAFKCQKSTVIIYHISTDEDPNTRNRNEVREAVQIKMHINTKSRLTDRSLGTRFFMSRDTWGRLMGPRDEVLCELWHLGQTDWSLGMRFLVSCDTWGRLMGPLG